MQRRRVLSAALAAILPFTVAIDGTGAIWVPPEREFQIIQEALLPDYKGYRLVYACDYGSLRDTLIPGMQGLTDMSNLSLSALVGYVIGCAAAGASGVAAAARTASGATTVLSTRTATSVAFAAAENASLTSRLSASFTASVRQMIGTDIATWVAGATAQEFKNQADRLKSELGMSDYFVFAKVVEQGDVWEAGVEVLGGQMATLPLGAPLNIWVLPATRESRGPLPLVLLKEPRIDFGRLGSSLKERTITGETRPTTVPFVFAYEKVDGKVVRRQDGNQSVRVTVEKGDLQSGGKVVGGMNLTNLRGVGYGGLREVHLSSPANMGVLCKTVNDDLAIALVLNQETISLSGPSYPTAPGKNLKIPVFIKGLHDSPRDVQLEDGRTYSWKTVAKEVLGTFSCRGAGVSQTYAQDLGTSAELWCTPTKPGKVSVVVTTHSGEVVFPNVAVVVGETVEGRWKLRNNGSVVKILPDPKSQTFYAVLEVDNLQNFNRGDVIWKPIIPSPADPNVFDATETRWNGRGGRESSQVRLGLRDGVLVYQIGSETYFFDRQP